MCRIDSNRVLGGNMASFRLRKIGGTLGLGLLLLTCVACSAGTTQPTATALRPSRTAPAEAAVLSTAAPARTPVPPAMERLPIPTLTGTPEPVLNLAELRQSNGDCQLPCWWSIVPGETAWASAESFFAPYALRIEPYERAEYTYITAYLIDPEQLSEHTINVDLAVWDDTVQLISTLGETGSRLTPSVVLGEYGIPDEIWVKTSSDSREGYLDFAVVLAYLGRGFLIHYGSQGTLDKEDVVGCIPKRDGSLRLLVWDPKLSLSFMEAMKIGMSTTRTTYFLDLEAATGMTQQDFYNDFGMEGSEVCLRTPRQLWPSP